MVVQHNLQAMNANRMLGLTTKTVSSSTEKLSSGYKINRAADDAAGLAISEKMRKQVRGLTQAASNAEDGISCVQTAEGALAEVQDMLQRMNELCVQAANGTNSKNDRQYIQDEIDQLVSEIDRIAETTKFNETFLLKGDQAGATKSVYITNYSVTYTKNEIPNLTNPTTYAMNYTGTNNIYIVENDVLSTNENVSHSAAKIQTGDDMTAYLIHDAQYTYNDGEAKLNTDDYTAFVNAELDSTVGGEDLETNGTDEVLRAARDLYIYDTSNGNVTRIPEGAKMTDYLQDDNTIDEQYRLIDILDSANGTSQRIANSVYGQTATTAYVTDVYHWDNLEIDESLQKLYDADGLEVSGIALGNYFDEQGNYIGGLYRTSQARAVDEVFTTASTLIADSTATIGQYITQSSQQVYEALEFNLHVGAQSDRKNKITAQIETLTAAGIGIDRLASYNIGIVDESGANATDAIDVVDEALTAISRQRSALGAVQNRLEHTVANLDNVVENTTAAESSIRDTDMAEEMVKNANANILQQAGQAMLAQANQANEGVLQLLQ